MGKIAKIGTGIIVVAAIAQTAGAWYSGKKIAELLPAYITQSDALLAQVGSIGPVKIQLELASLDTGLFSSTAIYRVKLHHDPEAEPLLDGDGIEVLFKEDFSHGPFPLSRLAHGQLTPVMCSSQYALEKNQWTEKWFALTGDKAPLQGNSTVDYGKNYDVTLRLLPIEHTMGDDDDDFRMSFSGMNMTFSGQDLLAEVEAKGKSSVTASMEFLKAHLPSEKGKSANIELLGARLQGTSDLTGAIPSGESRLQLDEVRIFSDRAPTVTFNDFAVTAKLSEQNSHLRVDYAYDIARVAAADKDIGALHVGLSLQNLDMQALQQIHLVQRQLLQEGTRAEDLFSSERMFPVYETLLRANPEIAFNKISVKTPHGESTASAALQLQYPEGTALGSQEFLRNMLAKGKFDVRLSKPMVADLVKTFSSISGSGDTPEKIETQAQSIAEMLGAMAVAMQLGKIEGTDVVSTLTYADHMVDLNGQKIPPDEFANFLLRSASRSVLGPGASGQQPSEPSQDD